MLSSSLDDTMVFCTFKGRDFKKLTGNVLVLIYPPPPPLPVLICLPLQAPLDGLYSVGVHIKLWCLSKWLRRSTFSKLFNATVNTEMCIHGNTDNYPNSHYDEISKCDHIKYHMDIVFVFSQLIFQNACPCLHLYKVCTSLSVMPYFINAE